MLNIPSHNRPAQPLLAGIDIGGTKILGGLVSAEGTVLFEKRLPSRRLKLVEDTLALGQLLLAEARQRGRSIAGFGIGTTGFVDRSTGMLLSSMNMGVRNVPLGFALAEHTGLPVAMDNDVHAATLGELYFGAGRRYPDFLLYNAGTGLATGMVFNGRLHRGISNAAGENGHISSHQGGATICSCGMSGCIEMLLLDARKGLPTVPAWLPKIEAPANKEFGYLALNLVQLVNLLNPEAIVLAGGMFTGDPGMTEWVRRAVRAHALPIAEQGLKEMPLSATAPSTGLVGAAALVLEAGHANQETEHASRA